MSQWVTVWRAAHLVGVPRGVLQQRVRNGELPLSDGLVSTDTLLRLYPQAQLEDSGLLEHVLPGFAAYLERGRRPYVDGGYYTKTPENRPLIGPLPGAAGAFVLAALSGFGIMAAPAAGELVAAHVAGAPLPDWHRAFLHARYDDPAYARAAAQAGSGQL
jgi:glycine/D-amino acid oxidase-like deaminating enzyme